MTNARNAPNIAHFEGGQLDGLTRIRDAVSRLDVTRVFDMSEMGTGKTLVQIQLIVDEIKRRGRYPEFPDGYRGTLVTAPINTMFSWANQLKEFAPDLSWVLVFPSESPRLSSLGQDVYGQSLIECMINGTQRYDLYLMYYDTATLAFDKKVAQEAGTKATAKQRYHVAERFAAAMVDKFDRVVFDEATCFADLNASRTAMLIHPHSVDGRNKTRGSVWSTHILPKMRYVAMLTGTPVRKDTSNLWTMCRVLDGGEALGVGIHSFRQAYQHCQQKRVGFDARGKPRLVRIYTDREGAFESIIQRMQRTIVLVRNGAENMPELETINASYTMPSELEAMYLEMRAKALLEMPDGSSAMALHKAAMVGKLCQISSGAIYNDDGGYTVLDRTRYQQIVRLVRKFGKSVVFFQWRHQAAELKKELEAAGFKVASMFTDKGALSNNQRNAVMDEFQKGDADVFLSHPKSSGHGITLTAAHAVIWASPMADLELYLQGSARVHRKGQTKKTYLINVSAKNTGGSEGRMVALLTQKHQAQDQFFDALWAAIEGGGSHGDTSHT